MSIPTAKESRNLVAEAHQFRAVLEAARQKVEPHDWSWYAYDTLGVCSHLEEMLAPSRRDLLDLIAGRPVLDIGCGDGELSFLFESLGSRVTAVDNSATGANKMRGVRALREALGSKIEILDIDIDNSSLPPPAEPYGVALALGILYHLRNPFHLLDEIAKYARYCLLSTRVARLTPDRSVNLDRLPVAYLVDSTELNADHTNYWIFSPAGLNRLIHRAGWQVVESTTVGAREASDPVRPEADERYFCLLKRRDIDDEEESAGAIVRLTHGWHLRGPAEERWRWTRRSFGLTLDPSRGAQPAVLELSLYIHPLLIERFGTMTLTACSGDAALASQRYSQSGVQSFEVPLGPGVGRIDFTLDHSLAPSDMDGRELGVVVSEIDVR